MANSSIINVIKNKVVKEFIKDEDIVQAINATEITSPEKLIGSHIFSYHQNPNTINLVGTYITLQVHIPQPFYRNDTFVSPTLEIWIISHESNMLVNNIPKVTDNRNDYLSRLIDHKLNGRSDFGIGKLKMLSNIEGSYQRDYLYRKLVFEGTDINNSLCEDEE